MLSERTNVTYLPLHHCLYFSLHASRVLVYFDNTIPVVYLLVEFDRKILTTYKYLDLLWQYQWNIYFQSDFF